MPSKLQAPDQQEVDPRLTEEDALLNDFFQNQNKKAGNSTTEKQLDTLDTFEIELKQYE